MIFFKNIAKNLQAGLHFGHLYKVIFSTRKGAVLCAIPLLLINATEQNLQVVR